MRHMLVGSPPTLCVEDGKQKKGGIALRSSGASLRV